MVPLKYKFYIVAWAMTRANNQENGRWNSTNILLASTYMYTFLKSALQSYQQRNGRNVTSHSMFSG
jgi:hypothetical protein